MDVLYTCDNNYVWLMGISTLSLFENNNEIDQLNVWLLGKDISHENRIILNELGNRFNRKITILDVPELDIPDTIISSRWPISAFTRLYSGELLPNDLKKVLYLDCDTIIDGSISELENWDVSENVFWGVKDCIGSLYKKNIGIEPNGLYVNAGVLLINLEKLRKLDIKGKLETYMIKYKHRINYADQDVLNGSFKNQIGVLPPQYDVMTIVASFTYEDIVRLRKPTNYYNQEEILKAKKNPILIHYTTNMRTVRPWFSNGDHPYTSLFLKYYKMSPWGDIELKEFKFSSGESKIINVVNKMPKRVSLSVLGFMHSVVKPIMIKIKSKVKK